MEVTTEYLKLLFFGAVDDVPPKLKLGAVVVAAGVLVDVTMPNIGLEVSVVTLLLVALELQ